MALTDYPPYLNIAVDEYAFHRCCRRLQVQRNQELGLHGVVIARVTRVVEHPEFEGYSAETARNGETGGAVVSGDTVSFKPK